MIFFVQPIIKDRPSTILRYSHVYVKISASYVKRWSLYCRVTTDKQTHTHIHSDPWPPFFHHVFLWWHLRSDPVFAFVYRIDPSTKSKKTRGNSLPENTSIRPFVPCPIISRSWSGPFAIKVMFEVAFVFSKLKYLKKNNVKNSTFL